MDRHTINLMQENIRPTCFARVYRCMGEKARKLPDKIEGNVNVMIFSLLLFVSYIHYYFLIIIL